MGFGPNVLELLSHRLKISLSHFFIACPPSAVATTPDDTKSIAGGRPRVTPTILAKAKAATVQTFDDALVNKGFKI